MHLGEFTHITFSADSGKRIPRMEVVLLIVRSIAVDSIRTTLDLSLDPLYDFSSPFPPDPFENRSPSPVELFREGKFIGP